LMTNEGIKDPLSKRLGRSFAASPAILLGIACMNRGQGALLSLCGVDRQKLEMDIEVFS
jgi:hypothetical protein